MFFIKNQPSSNPRTKNFSSGTKKNTAVDTSLRDGRAGAARLGPPVHCKDATLEAAAAETEQSRRASVGPLVRVL